jgi:hypothetical protein
MSLGFNAEIKRIDAVPSGNVCSIRFSADFEIVDFSGVKTA